MLKLQLVTGPENPFDQHPQLREIWEGHLRQIAYEGVQESLDLIETHEIGDIFLVLKDDAVIGLTGYFPFIGYAPHELHAPVRELGLRWHGIIPSERGKGYSREVLQMVAVEAGNRFPQADTLIELVPVTAETAQIREYFELLGFKADGPTERYDWADHDWQPYRIHLDTLMQLGVYAPARGAKP